MKQTRHILIESILIDKLPINPSVLALADFIRGGGEIPPIKLQRCSNGGFKLKDGRHRVCAYKLLGIKNIEANIKINGKTKFIGSFTDELGASKAYQKARKELHDQC